MPKPHEATQAIAMFQQAMGRNDLSDGQKADIAKRFLELRNTIPPPRWSTNPGPQAAAYLSVADELYFGGSAGPGKSAMLLGLALTAHTRSLVLRLEGSHLAELKDQLQAQTLPGDHWKSIGNGGEFYTHDGRKLEMLGCDDEKRASALQGRPHDLKAYDELPHFPEKVFRRINAWLRTTDPDQRCRVVGAGNPPLRPEEEWVLKYWGPWLDDQNHLYPMQPGELAWFTTIDGRDEQVADGSPIKTHYRNRDEIIQPLSRTFIPALLEHNPDLDRTNYRAKLQALPEPMRSQLLYGDMQVGRLDHENQVVPTEWVVTSMRKRWRSDGRGDRKMDAAALDVALGGEDRVCLAKRYGMWIAPLLTWSGRETDDPVTLIIKVLVHLETTNMPFLVDVLATPGGSVVTALRLKMPTINTVPVNFGAGSTFKDKSGRLEMQNLRAEAYWRLREALDPSLESTRGPRLALPDDPELMSEICSIRWEPVGGRVKIEKKDEVKKRLGRSPDKADAVAMSLLPGGSVRWLAPKEKEDDGRDRRRERNPSVGQYGAGSFMGVG